MWILLLLLAADVAHATPPCMAREDPFPIVFPAVQGPANVRLLLPAAIAADELALTALDAPTGAIPYTLAPAGDDLGSVWLIPEPTLGDGRVLRLAWQQDGARQGEFSSSAEADELVPSAPDVAIRLGETVDWCCPQQAAKLSAQAPGELGEAAFVRVVIEDETGRRTLVLPYANYVEIARTEAACHGDDPLALDHHPRSVTVTAIDWAGNESAPSAPAAFELPIVPEPSAELLRPKPFPTNDASGCSAATGSPLLALFGLTLLLRRRAG